MADPARSPLAVIRDYFAGQDWPVVEDGDRFDWAYLGTDSQWYGQTWWLAEPEHLLVYAMCATEVPPERQADLIAFVAAVNTRLVAGGFEFDPDEDQLRFRLGLPVDGGELSPALVRRVIETVVATTEAHLPEIDGLIG